MYIKTLERKCKNLPVAHATHTGLDNALAKRPLAKALNTLSVVCTTDNGLPPTVHTHAQAMQVVM